ncbi:MAG: tyrosine-type recombinase/integrase [Candidatus Staskawiczbacteria bacterium]|nr:tyrosine-type recombinase/integrase [Candidatus Staskawiczbacteria bacterium]
MKVKEQFEPFVQYKVKQGCAQHTITEYRRFISETLSCIAEKKLSQLRVIDRVDIMELGRQHGYWGEQRAVSTFRQFCQYLNDKGEKLPFRFQDILVPSVIEREQDYLLPEEFEDFMNKIPLDFYGLRDRCLYELLWSTGCRIGEALAINIDDINFKEKEIKVKTFKGGEGTRVFISERMEGWLKEWLAKRGDNCPALFIVYFGDIVRLKRSMSNKRLLAYRKAFRITKKISHKAFRTGFATYLMEQGANIKEVQVLCRHRSPRTTLKSYLKYQKTKVKDVHQNIFNNLTSKFKNIIRETAEVW